jgi:di/tricarboxylate transporter
MLAYRRLCASVGRDRLMCRIDSAVHDKSHWNIKAAKRWLWAASKTLVVLGAALGLESVIAGSVLSRNNAEVCASVGGRSPRFALAVISLPTMVIANLIGYAAAAGFMFPVAMSMSEMLGVNFRPFAIVLMLAASCTFINPPGFQTNLMVQKDGGYAFKDFGRVGIPLAFIVGAFVLLLAPIVYGR